MNNAEAGILPRLMARVFGERAARLTERVARTHWLSYLLILSQSVAVVLVLGHAELPLLFAPSWAIRSLAALGLFVLVSTVLAADMALLATLRRIPVLARNRQRGQLREHVFFAVFVLFVEASTYAVVLAALDTNPHALVSNEPLIPNAGPVFVAQVILRAVLVCWAAVQLVIVRGKLPVLLSTLTATGKEIVGAHVERRLAGLDIGAISLPAAFRVYAAMSKPPRRIKTFWNGWLVARELAAEDEEARQVANVVDALEDLETRQHGVTQLRPPTGPGTPAPAPVRTDEAAEDWSQTLQLVAPPRPRRTTARAKRAATMRARQVRTGKAGNEPYEVEAITAWLDGARSLPKMMAATGMSRAAASGWVRTLKHADQNMLPAYLERLKREAQEAVAQ